MLKWGSLSTTALGRAATWVQSHLTICPFRWLAGQFTVQKSKACGYKSIGIFGLWTHLQRSGIKRDVCKKNVKAALQRRSHKARAADRINQRQALRKGHTTTRDSLSHSFYQTNGLSRAASQLFQLHFLITQISYIMQALSLTL